MDRNREGRKGGSASSHRRSRTTGLKDSSGVDDDDNMEESHNSRFREKTKKENSNVSTSVNNMHISRNKRTSQNAQETRGHRSIAEERDETTDETETGVSEDDDDFSPSMSRQMESLKFQGKSADEGSAVISAVPRKARTVMSKRPLEPLSPPIAVKQPFSSSVTSLAATNSIHILSSTTTRAGRRMNPCGPQPRPPKLPKVSTPVSISEQEAEIAEALFDLARMLPSASVSEMAKANSEPDIAVPITGVSLSPTTSMQTKPGPEYICSPAPPLCGPSFGATGHSSAGLTSSVQEPGSTLAEAPKRKKRPRIKKSGDAGSFHTNLSRPSSANSGGILIDYSKENLQVIRSLETEKIHAKTESSVNALSINSLMTSSEPQSSAVSPPVTVHLPCPMDSKNMGMGEVVTSKVENDSTMPRKVLNDAFLIERKGSVDSSGCILSSQKNNESVSESSNFANLMSRVAISSTSNTTHYVKRGINSTEIPKQIAAVVGEKTTDQPGLGIADDKDMKIVAAVSEKTADQPGLGIADNEDMKNLGAGAISSWMDRARDEHDDIQSKSKKDKENGNFDGGDKETSNLDLHKGERKETSLSGNLNERSEKKADETKLMKSISSNDVTPPDVTESFDIPALNDGSSSRARTSPVCSIPLPVTMKNITLPISMSDGHGSLSFGYLTPAVTAATGWPAAMPFSRTPSVDEKSNSYKQIFSAALSDQYSWKNCSRHVYIAHYIHLQQQMQRHLLWVTSHGNTAASLYGTKPYNLNVPVSCADAMFPNATDVTTISSGSTISAPAVRDPNLSTVSHPERSDGATENMHVLKDSTYLDELAKKNCPQQSLEARKQQEQPHLSLSLQAGHVFGFHITQGSPAICNALSNATSGCGVGVTGDVSSIGGNLRTSSGSTNVVGSVVVGPGPCTTNGSVMNGGASQVQYFQAMMQQSGFPFSFPPVHFNPAFAGSPSHIAQQATQLFSNPFYGGNFVPSPLHSHQSQLNASSGLPFSQKHQLCTQSSESPQEQKSIHSFLPSQYQFQHVLETDSLGLSDKEGAAERKINSLTESKNSALQRTMYNHAVANLSSVFAADTPTMSLDSNDLLLTGTVGANQSLKVQQQQTSRQMQNQQQSSIPSQQQWQQLVTTQHYTSSPVISTNTKNMEAQAYSNMFLSNLSNDLSLPGTLTLSPGAAVMAPQGHAMLQAVEDLSRCHSQSSPQLLPKQSNHQSTMQVLNQQSTHVQRPNLNSVEDNCTTIDEVKYTSGNRMHDLWQERKSPVQISLVVASSSSLEATSIVQGPTNGVNGNGLVISHASSNPEVPFSNSMANFSSHRKGQSTISASMSVTPVNQLSRPNMIRMKAPSNAASPPASAEVSVNSFTELNPVVNLHKYSASGLPFTGEAVSNGSQNVRHGHAVQQSSQIKSSQKMLSMPPVQTLPSTSVGSATLKLQGKSQSRSQHLSASMSPGSRLSPASGLMPVGSLPPASMAAGSRLSPASAPFPFPSLPPAYKSVAAVGAKSSVSSKSSYSNVHKMSGASSVKRSSSVSLQAPPNVTVGGPISVGQNNSSKAVHLQQYQQIQHGMQQQQQHLSQGPQQSHAILTTSQPSFLQQYSHLPNASQPSAYLLQREGLQCQQLDRRQQITLQHEQQSYLQQQDQKDSTQLQPLLPQFQVSVHPAQQSRLQQAQYPSLITSENQHQHNKAHKLSQPYQTLQSSYHSLPASSSGVVNGPSPTPVDFILPPGSARRTSVEGVSPGYQATGSRSLKLTGNSINSCPQKSSISNPSIIQVPPMTIGQEHAIIVTRREDEASHDPMNAAHPVSIPSSGQLQYSLSSSPSHQPQEGN